MDKTFARGRVIDPVLSVFAETQAFEYTVRTTWNSALCQYITTMERRSTCEKIASTVSFLFEDAAEAHGKYITAAWLKV